MNNTDAEGEIDTAQSDINNAEAVIGNETDTYSASSTYALGDLVIYNSLLYKCTTAITVAEAWNSAKWTQVSLTSLANEGNVYSTEEKVIGTWIDGKPIYRKIITGLTFAPKPAGETYTNSYLTVVEQLIDVKMTRSGSTAVAVCSANHPQNRNTMNIFAITEFSNCDTLILEFTKTTD